MTNKEIIEAFDFEYFRDAPNKPGYVVHDKFCTYEELKTALIAYLQEHIINDIRGDHHFEYIETGAPWEQIKKQMPSFSHIYCFATPGSNEGYYIHVQSTYHEKINSLMILKLFTDIDTLIELNSIITKFIIQILQK